jgi:hypothetical protein
MLATGVKENHCLPTSALSRTRSQARSGHRDRMIRRLMATVDNHRESGESADIRSRVKKRNGDITTVITVPVAKMPCSMKNLRYHRGRGAFTDLAA